MRMTGNQNSARLSVLMGHRVGEGAAARATIGSRRFGSLVALTQGA